MGNQIINTTAEDLQNYQSYAVGNTVSGMRAELDIINRRLVTLYDRLLHLTDNEKIVKARIINNIDMIYINANLTADSPVEAIQSLVNTVIGPNPDQNLGFDKSQLANKIIGIKALDAELGKIDFEVKAVQQKIKFYENERDSIQAQLQAATQNKPNNFIDKTFGRFLPLTPEDLEKDRIAKARVANLLLLYRLCLRYRNYSTNPTTGSPGFPDDPKLARNLIIIQQTFAAVAKGFPNGEFLTGSTALDLDNPGAGGNAQILLRKIGADRATATNDKLGSDVKKYVDDLTALSQDTFASEGIQKKPSPLLPSENSMRAQTVSYPASVLNLNGLYAFSFECASILDAVRNVFKRDNGYLFQDLPTCPNVVPLTPVATDNNLLQQRINQSAIQAKAIADYQKQKADAEAAQAKVNFAAVFKLPEDAPEWVIRYADAYGDADKGDIVVNETDPAFSQKLINEVTADLQKELKNATDPILKEQLNYQIKSLSTKTTVVSIYVARAWSRDEAQARKKVDTNIASFYNGKVPDDTIYYSYLSNGTWYFYARADRPK
jgi:hypothetical protein